MASSQYANAELKLILAALLNLRGSDLSIVQVRMKLPVGGPENTMKNERILHILKRLQILAHDAHLDPEDTTNDKKIKSAQVDYAIGVQVINELLKQLGNDLNIVALKAAGSQILAQTVPSVTSIILKEFIKSGEKEMQIMVTAHAINTRPSHSLHPQQRNQQPLPSNVVIRPRYRSPSNQQISRSSNFPPGPPGHLSNPPSNHHPSHHPSRQMSMQGVMGESAAMSQHHHASNAQMSQQQQQHYVSSAQMNNAHQASSAQMSSAHQMACSQMSQAHQLPPNAQMNRKRTYKMLYTPTTSHSTPINYPSSSEQQQPSQQQPTSSDVLRALERQQATKALYQHQQEQRLRQEQRQEAARQAHHTYQAHIAQQAQAHQAQAANQHAHQQATQAPVSQICTQCKNNTMMLYLPSSQVLLQEPFICFPCRSHNVDPFVKTLRTVISPKLVNFTNMETFTVPAAFLSALSSGNISLKLYCFCILDGVEKGICWPRGTQLRLNDKIVRGLIQKHPPNANPHPRDGFREYSVTLSPLQEGMNTLRCETAMAKKPRLYVILLQLVQTQTLNAVVQSVFRSPQCLTFDQAKANVMRSFGDDGDDVVVTSTRLPLNCPLSLCRIVYPARGKKCTHLQCFDLETFLQFNIRATSKAWHCVVCHKFIAFHDLIVDAYLMNILKKESRDSELEEVELTPDGSWRPKKQAKLEGEKEGSVTSSSSVSGDHFKQEPPNSNPNSPRISPCQDNKYTRLRICDIMNNSSSPDVAIRKLTEMVHAASASSSPSAKPPETKPSETIVDLSLSSDEEDVVMSDVLMRSPPSRAMSGHPSLPPWRHPPSPPSSPARNGNTTSVVLAPIRMTMNGPGFSSSSSVNPSTSSSPNTHRPLTVEERNQQARAAFIARSTASRSTRLSPGGSSQ